MACRDVAKAESAADEIKKALQNHENTGSIVVKKLDLASLSSVRECAKEIMDQESHVHLLINNAGVMLCPKTETEDGFELQMGTNHFGHFLFTLLLLPLVKKSTPARIVNVSSVAHRRMILFKIITISTEYFQMGRIILKTCTGKRECIMQ